MNQLDYEEHIIRKYMSEIPIIVTNPRFANLPQITKSMQAVTMDFPDDKLLDAPAIQLDELTDLQVAEIGRRVIPMLAHGFTRVGIGELMVLAAHIKAPEDGSQILTLSELHMGPEDIPASEISVGNVPTEAPVNQYPVGRSIREEATLYSYLAASTLRLFTKGYENYMKAYNHIMSGFQKFYGYQTSVLLHSPQTDAIRTLAYQYNHDKLYSNTLYKILYAGGTSTKGIGMRKFLYEMHLANTGMHIVSIFVRLCTVMNCTTSMMLSAINTSEHSRQINALITMVELAADTENNHMRKMWKYGRIFDETFMLPLQTKSCPQLVYVLASALKSESPQTNQNILDIKQLADLNPLKKARLAAAGEKLLMMIRKIQAGGDPN